VTQRQDIHFPPKDAALRDDVHVLGGMVGEVLRDQGGEALLQLVEADRQVAIRRREGDPRGAVDMLARTQGRAPELARDLVRAFSTWFQVVNLAEKVHRIRRRREYMMKSDRPQPGGIGDCMFRLKAAGVTAEQVLGALAGLTIYPVFMAHPTESTRRSILRNRQRIAALMMERLNASLTPGERRHLIERIRFEVTTGWQTQELPRERLTAADEREHVLFYLVEVIYRVLPSLYEELEYWLDHVFGIPAHGVELPGLLRFGTWVGGDMDGNPDVHAKTLRETLQRHQRLIISTYYEECRALASRLSQSESRIGTDRELERRLAEYTTLLPAGQELAQGRHDRMPYRIFLLQVAERLRITYDGRPNSYEHAAEFVADIERVADSLRAHRGQHAGLFLVERLLCRARTFGFHLATLDVRQHARVHREVIGQGMDDPAWTSRPAAERQRRLAEALARDEAPSAPLDATGRRTLAVFEAMLQGRTRFGAPAVGDYIVSGTEAADDVLSVLLLARWADTSDRTTGQVPFDIVPMLEAEESLGSAGEILAGICGEPAYAAHLEARGRRQTVLVGYSESNRSGGIAASRYAVYRAQSDLVRAAAETSVALGIFHGRGGTAIRGGGPIEVLVQSAPPGAVSGCLRATEQGEVVANNYALEPLALRTFEQAIHAVLLATAGRKAGPVQVSRHDEVMAVVARASRERYRALVFGEPRFEPWFRNVTPIDVIERMQIGSRSSTREWAEGLAALRSIPWVFAWTQSRHTLPGWYGVGSGLEAAARELGAERLSQAWSGWPWFAHFIDDVENQLLRADLGIASLYDELAPEGCEALPAEVRREHALACRWITWIKGETDLLDDDPRMQRSFMLRSPYLDPMHHMQLDLLRRWRATGREDRALYEALLASISGIAQGLQATG
jgi:phosphoenolpyruvate carboxylase